MMSVAPARRADPNVDVLREFSLHERRVELGRAFRVLFVEHVAERAAAHLELAVAGDVARARIREEQLPFRVEDDDAVRGALEKVGVALERLHAALCFEARDGDLLRLIAQRLENTRVAKCDRHRAGDRLAERELAIAEHARLLRAEEEHAHRLTVVEDRQDRERRERGAAARLRPDELHERMRRGVFDDERLPARQDLLDLGILREIDRKVTELLVVGRRDDVAHRPRRLCGRPEVLVDEHDRHAVDLRHLGETLDDGKEDRAKIEVRGERLRQLEDDLRVRRLLAELLFRLRAVEADRAHARRARRA